MLNRQLIQSIIKENGGVVAVAKEIGVDKASLSRFMNNENKTLTIKSICLLAGAYDLDFNDLLTKINPMGEKN